jgi:hypothetical protein
MVEYIMKKEICGTFHAGFDVSFRDCPAKGGTGGQPISHACYMSRTSNLIASMIVYWRIEINKAPHYAIYASSCNFPSQYRSETSSIFVVPSLKARDKVPQPYKTKDKIITLYILICVFYVEDGETKHRQLKGRKHSTNWICS